MLFSDSLNHLLTVVFAFPLLLIVIKIFQLVLSDYKLIFVVIFVWIVRRFFLLMLEFILNQLGFVFY